MSKDNAAKKSEKELPPHSLIQSDDLRAIMGGVSDMWLWRHLKDGSLPQPLMISRRRFWRRDEIYKFIERESAKRAGLDGGH